MDFENIDRLVEKYWKGETSIEEERRLGDFFRKNTAPDHLKDAAAMFHYFDSERSRELNDISFEQDFRRRTTTRGGFQVRMIYNAMRIAAGVLVLVLAVWLVRLEVRKSSVGEADTYDDPKVAFEETKKALLMISKSFGTAEEQARKINVFNEAQEELRKEAIDKEL